MQGILGRATTWLGFTINKVVTGYYVPSPRNRFRYANLFRARIRRRDIALLPARKSVRSIRPTMRKVCIMQSTDKITRAESLHFNFENKMESTDGKLELSKIPRRWSILGVDNARARFRRLFKFDFIFCFHLFVSSVNSVHNTAVLDIPCLSRSRSYTNDVFKISVPG